MSRSIPSGGVTAAWLFLLMAIVAEVIGVSFLAHAARAATWGGYVVMAAALAMSYFFLALSVRRITVGVAYATWEGVGLTLLTAIGIVFFGEHVSTQQLAGLVLALVGIICVTLGAEHS